MTNTPSAEALPTPDANTGNEAGRPSPAPPSRDRSCGTCNRRKVRCNKAHPCAACIRGGHECVYPDSSLRTRRRPRKTTIADVASRVSDLERSIVEGSLREGPRQHDLSDGRRQLASPGSTASRETRPSESLGEILVQNGTASQYMNEPVMSRILEADGDRGSLLGTPSSLNLDQTTDSPRSLMGILSHPSAYYNHPLSEPIPKLSGMRLWQAFVQNMDAFVKVLHIPTTEVAIFTAIHNPDTVKKDIMALMHAVYFAAVTSLEPEEVMTMLGMRQKDALTRFKVGFQKALAEADILENPTVTLIQALIIYLHVSTVWNNSLGLWMLNGLTLRMAQCIGLHTDGSKLGLSPFDAEIRRRVWWHLFSRDSRAVEDHGISPQLQVIDTCTRLPLNIEDSDMTPDMEDLPSERNTWTTMTFPLVNMVIADAFTAALPSPKMQFEPGERKQLRDRTFKSLKDKLEGYFAMCNPIIPLQKITSSVGLAVYHKLDLFTRQQVANLETPNDRDAFATDENLLAACTALEIQTELWKDELVRPHRWSSRVHPQYHLLLYALWHLCLRPEGPYVERAWLLVSEMFRVEQRRLADVASGPSLKYQVLLRLRRKAEAIRDSRGAVAVPLANAEHEDVRTREEDDFLDTSQFAGQLNAFEDTISGEWMTATDGMGSLPDWNTLVGDLQIDVPNFSGML